MLAAAPTGGHPQLDFSLRHTYRHLLRSSTPELATNSCVGSSNQSPNQEQKLFPIFRPRGERRIIHIIRHGESEYNAATQFQKGFADPQIFDPKLTEKGRRQAAALRQKMRKIPTGALWLTSPLTRAIDTMMLACPEPERMGAACKPLKVEVRSELAEHVVTTGDIGLPTSLLRERYPQLAGGMTQLKELWWWQPGYNSVPDKSFGRSEPKKQMKERVGKLRKWLQDRPEKVIVAFGHSSFWNEFLGGKRLRNCEVHEMFL
eukprot:jgi/Astpho2/6278/Aster-03673